MPKKVISQKKVLVLCVDRDNDLGRKTGIVGPVIGREKNLEAATALLLKDPEESDGNAIFASVKKFDELSKEFREIELATLTGHKDRAWNSDKEINRQLEKVFAKFKATHIVFVTDGADDDQVMPILQSHAKLLSKITVIIKQSQAVESTYYTIINGLKDPFIARVIFGVPGLILLLWFALGSYSFQIIAFLLGIYLLIKGFGIEELLGKAAKKLSESISITRASFPFYVGSLVILLFGIYSTYLNFENSLHSDLFLRSVTSIQSIYVFIGIAGIAFLIGKITDSVQLNQAFNLKKYFLSMVSVLLAWFIVDLATQVILEQSNLLGFIIGVLACFIIFLIAIKLSDTFEVRNKITSLLLDLPVYSHDGTKLGLVKSINKKTNSLTYIEFTKNKEIELKKPEFELMGNSIQLI